MIRSRTPAGVVLEGRPRLGAGVVLDVDPGARVLLEDGCVLEDGVRIHARGAALVHVGAGARLGERSVVLAHDRVEIGPSAVIDAGAVLVDFAHSHASAEVPVRLQPLVTAPVVVGAGARVGINAVLERGTRIRPGGTVAPHAVVRAR